VAFHGHHPRSNKKLYSAREAAERLGISLTHLYRMSKSGEIGSVRAGVRRLYRPEDLDRRVQGLPPAFEVVQTNAECPDLSEGRRL
jgi:excisionase family DNA binding protein